MENLINDDLHLRLSGNELDNQSCNESDNESDN